MDPAVATDVVAFLVLLGRPAGTPRKTESEFVRRPSAALRGGAVCQPEASQVLAVTDYRAQFVPCRPVAVSEKNFARNKELWAGS